MEYSVVIVKDTQEGGYIGMCRELPEAKSQGETIEELLENMKDAIKLTLEVRKEGKLQDFSAIRMNQVIQNNKNNIIVMSADKKTPNKKESKPSGGKTITPRKIVKLTKYRELVRDPFGLEL